MYKIYTISNYRGEIWTRDIGLGVWRWQLKTEIKEINYNKNMGNDEHLRNFNMEWLETGKSILNKQRKNAYNIYAGRRGLIVTKRN